MLVYEVVSLPVRVTGKADRVGPFLDYSIKLLVILGGVQRNMHGQDYEVILGNSSEAPLDEGSLALTAVAHIALAAVRLKAPVHIVQHDEVHLSVIEGVIRRTINSLEGFIRKTILLGLEI